MATIFTHPIPVAAVAAACGPHMPPRLAVAMLIASVLPDIDMIGYALGHRHPSLFAHRGFTHSLAFALAVGLLALAAAPRMKTKRGLAFFAVFLTILSHSFLDALGGYYGVSFFQPFDEARYALPWPSFISSWLSWWSPHRLFSSWWADRFVRIELLTVWTPCAIFALAGFLFRRIGRK
ncbi:MAG: metal-dependent hydrolase [Deltaproteobacteria bacterium]|nr:metal-dependent hydrolase [Deltaproteobacteria bacterium]